MNEQPPARAPRDQPTEDQHQQMARFGITAEQKNVYRYKGYVYERLADALAYATIDTARETESQTTGKAGSASSR